MTGNKDLMKPSNPQWKRRGKGKGKEKDMEGEGA